MLLPIATNVDHHDHAAILPLIALLPLSPIAIVLPLCHLVSPLNAPLPRNMQAGCHVGLVVLASSLVVPQPLNAPAGYIASQCTTL
jgi:hypothetical protein